MSRSEKLMTSNAPDQPARGAGEAGTELASLQAVLAEHDPDEYPSLTEYVTAAVKDAILSRALPPMTRLREESLAQELGVSRLPVREAFKLLSAQGLVVLRPHGRGAAVAQLTREMLQQVYQIRAALEVLSVSLAAKGINDAALDELDTVVRQGTAAVQESNWRNAAILGSEFHRIIARGSGNDHLADLIESYDEKLRWANEPVSLDRGVELWQEHQAIAAALRQRDQAACERLMKEHTKKSGASLSSRVKEEADEPATSERMPRCV